MNVTNNIQFPEFKGIKCRMMPFIQGDSSSLPEEFASYAEIVDNNYLEKGKIGYLTIDESHVEAGKSQRGYNSKGIDRNVHVEVGRHSGNKYRWGGGGWGGRTNAYVDGQTRVLIANSIDDTCRVWDKLEWYPTKDGDLSDIIDQYPEDTGILMKAGQMVHMSVFTPHECIAQKQSGPRQFIRIVGTGVTGREDYFTINPKVEHLIN